MTNFTTIRTTLLAAACMAGMVLAAPASATTVTGNPAGDGWNLFGHSLQNGIYVTGSANYGFDAYGAALTVTAGSNLQIDDGEYSWLVGDTVLGVGGQFKGIDAATAGWAGFTGNAVNGLLPAPTGPKLQAKFGTADATWSASTVAPGSGNGSSSSSAGGGRVQVRTSGFFQAGTPTSGQTEPWTWDGNSGQLLVLDKEDHIAWGGDPDLDKRVARMIWIWDDAAGQVDSWELLLNVSLLARVAPASFTGLLPAIGDMAIITVQDGDNAFTDALVRVTALPAAVPEPATLALLGGGQLGAAALRRRRR